MDESRRTVLNFRVVLETNGSEADQRLLEAWVQDRMLNATKFPRPSQFVAVALVNKEGKVLRTATHGTPIGDSSDIVDELFDNDEN